VDAFLFDIRSSGVQSRPRLPAISAALVPSPTTVAVFLAQADRLGGRTMVRCLRAGAWRGITWEDARDRAFRIACGLVAAGVGPTERVAFLSEDRPESMSVQLGIQMAGAVPAVIASTAPAGVAQRSVGECGAVLAITSGELLAARLHLTGTLGRIVRLDGEVARWSEAEPEGTQYGEVLRRIRQLDPEGAAVIGYPAAGGAATTLTQRRLVSAAEGRVRAVGMSASDAALAVLAPDHLMQRILVGYMAIAAGATLCVALPADVPARRVAALQPTVLLAGPWLLEDLRHHARAGHPRARWWLRRRVGGRRLRAVFAPDDPGPESQAFFRAVGLPVQVLGSGER